MFVKKQSNSPKEPKEVDVVQTSLGVEITINGVVIASLKDNDNVLILVGGAHEQQTGLKASDCGHVRTIWDGDLKTSIRY